jgi:hypothetical protein
MHKVIGLSEGANVVIGFKLFVVLFVLVVSLGAREVHAAEGGFSFYLPGTVGDIALAQASEPGLQVANTVFYQSGDAGRAVLQGNVNVGLDLTLALDIFFAGYTFEQKVLGATYTVGAAIPYGYAKLEADITTAGGRSFSAERDATDIGDAVLVPLELTWTTDDLSIQLGHAIYAPTGAYDVDEVVNIGLNHWGFDTTLAATYFNLESGTEVSVSPGFIVNTKNDDTDYTSGNEFHLDFTANQFLSETFALGVRGYYYKQLTGDSGSGAILGDFKGEGFGLGPGFIWFPEFAAGKLAVLGKWIHDLDATNRFDSDYGTLTVAWTF